MSTLPCEIYASKLIQLRYGHPLWVPNPKTGQVFVGDVGYIKGGEFRALFNTLEDRLDPINFMGKVPAGFTPLDVSSLTLYGPEVTDCRRILLDGDSASR